MNRSNLILTGEKESFIVRVLLKKLKDAKVECSFVPFDINSINPAVDDNTSLVVLFMEDGYQPPKDVLHYLKDILEEKDIRMTVLGDHNDVAYVTDNMPGDLICSTFYRPVDNEMFVQSVTEYLNKLDSGEFRKSILIVDDDPSYLGLVREWLRGTYKVYMANSGLQAIKWLGKNKVDLILLDHEMPITSGPQVLEMLRSEEDTKSIPVMFLTGKGDKESVMKVVSLRPEGYFLKTIQKAELLEKLNEYFVLHK